MLFVIVLFFFNDRVSYGLESNSSQFSISTQIPYFFALDLNSHEPVTRSRLARPCTQTLTSDVTLNSNTSFRHLRRQHIYFSASFQRNSNSITEEKDNRKTPLVPRSWESCTMLMTNRMTVNREESMNQIIRASGIH